MRENNNSNVGGGLGLSTVLFLIFLVLKLCNVIDWSWWWVTAPLWINFIICILIFVGLFIYYWRQEAGYSRQTKKRGKKDGKD